MFLDILEYDVSVLDKLSGYLVDLNARARYLYQKC
jgi:hypothetical protein